MQCIFERKETSTCDCEIRLLFGLSDAPAYLEEEYKPTGDDVFLCEFRAICVFHVSSKKISIAMLSFGCLLLELWF
jgi:hypothetical protein